MAIVRKRSNTAGFTLKYNKLRYLQEIMLIINEIISEI